MTVVILGMHKSGTTLVSRILHESGISMGRFDPKIGYDQGNHYEREECNDLNRRLLGTPAGRSFEVVHRPRPPYPAELEAEAKRLTASLNARHDTWGFKDPRTCLTFDFWKKHLPDARIILVFRDPSEVWQHHLHPRLLKRLLYSAGKGTRVLRAWAVYNRSALEAIESFPKERVHVLEYSRFMTDPGAIDRLARFVGTPLTDLRKPEFYRSRLAYPRLFAFSRSVTALRHSHSIGTLLAELQRTATRH